MTRLRSPVCVLCGSTLRGRRPHARFCSGACRAEGSRLQAILSGVPTAAYRSIAERMSVAEKRTRAPLGAAEPDRPADGGRDPPARP